jgi:hypothetical protein
VNFLLANGHRLTSPVKTSKNMQALVVYYDLKQAKERLLTQCKSAIAKFDWLPLNAEGSKRNGNVLVRKAKRSASSTQSALIPSGSEYHRPDQRPNQP